MDATEVGIRLRECRRFCGLNQTELARLMCEEGHVWKQQTVTLLEGGNRNLLYTEAVTLRRLIGFDSGVPEYVEAEAAIALSRIRELLSERRGS